MITFAGIATNYTAHTLKFSVVVQNWPFYVLTNSLAIVMDMGAIDTTSLQSSCVKYNPKGEENLQWFTVVVDDVVLYPYISLLLSLASPLSSTLYILYISLSSLFLLSFSSPSPSVSPSLFFFPPHFF